MDLDVTTLIASIQACLGAAALYGLHDFKKVYQAESALDRKAMAGQNDRLTAVEQAVGDVQDAVVELTGELAELRETPSPPVGGFAP